MKVHHRDQSMPVRRFSHSMQMRGLAEADMADISQGSVTMYLANGSPVQVPQNSAYDGAIYNGQTVYTWATVQAKVQASQIAAQVAQQQQQAAAAAAAAAQVAQQQAAQTAAQQAATQAAANAAAVAAAAAQAAALKQQQAQMAAQNAALLQAQQVSAAAIAAAQKAAADAKAASDAAAAKANQANQAAVTAHTDAVSQGATVPAYIPSAAGGDYIVAGGSGGDLLGPVGTVVHDIGNSAAAPANRTALYAVLAVVGFLALRGR